ncbi:148aa long hypothetical protein [Pyrococcus horikoshii OT3]|uniref:Uncharacterized protein n=1 Tax=Pyrococcus horikoshii (strain ATCC 700860 / DSM 12428 / JCM 9974 / NBRC 100139 / OT-3) TaxID=70601 RepID=O59301_PYRHO|nr:148aa long hypothetical protein [Pyrococcus horikoshii OT3]
MSPSALIILITHHSIIITPLPLGFLSMSSSIVIASPPASVIFFLAVSLNFHAATMTFFSNLPAPRTLPGTTIISPSLAYLLILLTFTSALCLLGLSSLQAKSFQIFTPSSLDFFLRKRMSLLRFGSVGPVLFMKAFPLLAVKFSLETR